MNRWTRPTGRRALAVTGTVLALLVASNISATIFWHLTGGVGLLDLDGGENLAQPGTAQPLPAHGTPARVLALLSAYGPHARLAHTLLLCSLDLVFPAAVATMGWTAIAWAGTRATAPVRRGTLIVAGAVSLTYLLADWGENLTELLLLSDRRGPAVDLLPHLTAIKLEAIAVMLATMLAATALRRLRHRNHQTPRPQAPASPR
jgi:hypothetical protein